MKTNVKKPSAKRLLSLLLCLALACSLLPAGVLAAARTSTCPSGNNGQHRWNIVNNISYSLRATETEVGVLVYECSNCRQLRTVQVTPPTGTTYQIPYDIHKDYYDIPTIPDLDNLTDQDRLLHRNSVGCLLYGRVDVSQRTGYYHNNIGRTQVTVQASGMYDGLVLCGEPWYNDVLSCGAGFCDIRVERGQGEYYDPFNVYLVNFGITVPDYQNYRQVYGQASAHYEYDIDHPSTKGIKSITVDGDDINVYLINCNVGYQERWDTVSDGYGDPRGGDGFQDEINYSFTASVNGLNSHIYMGDETNSSQPGLVHCTATVNAEAPEGYVYCDTFEGNTYEKYFCTDDINWTYWDEREVSELASSVRLCNLTVDSLSGGDGDNGVLSGVAAAELYSCEVSGENFPDGFTLNDCSALSVSDMTLAVYEYVEEEYTEKFTTALPIVMNGHSELTVENTVAYDVTARGRNVLRMRDAEFLGNVVADDCDVPIFRRSYDYSYYPDTAHVRLKLLLGGSSSVATPNRSSGQTPEIMVANSALLRIYDDPDVKGMGSLTAGRGGYDDGGHYYCAAIGGIPDLFDPLPHGQITVNSGVVNASAYSGGAAIGGSSVDPIVAYVIEEEGHWLSYEGDPSELLRIYQNSSVGYYYFSETDPQFNPFEGGYWLRESYGSYYAVDSDGNYVTVPPVYATDENGDMIVDLENSVPGFSRDGGTITVWGGVVNAKAVGYGTAGAAIGGAFGGSGGNIQIAGGTVNAESSGGSAAIGGGAPDWGEPVRTGIGFENRHPDYFNEDSSEITDGIFVDKYTYDRSMGGGSGHIFITGASTVNAKADNLAYDENGDPVDRVKYYYYKDGSYFDPKVYDGTEGGSWKTIWTYTDAEYERSLENGVRTGKEPGFVIGSACGNANGYYENTIEVLTIGGIDGNPLLMLSQNDRAIFQWDGTLDASWDRFINEHKGMILDYEHRIVPDTGYNDPLFSPSKISGSALILKAGSEDGSHEMVSNIAQNCAYRLRGQINFPDIDYMFTLPSGTSFTLLDGTVMNVGNQFVLAVQDEKQFNVQDGAIVQGKGVWPGKPVNSPEDSPGTEQIKSLLRLRDEAAKDDQGNDTMSATHLGVAETSDGCVILHGSSAEEIRSQASTYSLNLLTIFNAGHYGFRLSDNTTAETWSLRSRDSDTVVSLVENGALTASPANHILKPFDVIVKESGGNVTVTLVSARLSTPEYTVYENTGADDELEFTFAPGDYSRELAFRIELDDDQVTQNKSVFSVPKFGGSEFTLNSVAPLKDKCAVRYGGVMKFTTPVADFAGININQLQLRYDGGFMLDGIEGGGHISVPSIAGFPVKGGAEMELNTFKGTRGISMSVNLETPIFEGAFTAAFKEARGVILLDTLYAELAVDEAGIPLVPPTVIGYLQGGRLGISGLADTVNMDSFGAPPVRLQIGAKGSIMDVIEGWIDLSVGLDGFDLTMSDIEIADLDFIKEMGIHASWDAGKKTIDGREYWGLSTDMGQYLVIAVNLPGTGVTDYYGDPVEIPAFISATGSVDYGGFVGYCVSGSKIYFVYRLTASALLSASLNIPKGIIGGFFPMSGVKLGSVDLGFYAAATASSSVDKSKMDGFSPTGILKQMAKNANIKFDAAIGAKVVVGAGLLKGNVRVIYVLGDKNIQIDGGWGEGKTLDLSGYVDRGTRSMSVLTSSRDAETGEVIPTIVEAGMQSVSLMSAEDDPITGDNGPEDIVLIRTRAANTFMADVSPAAAGKEFLVISLTDESKIVDGEELTIRYYSDSEPEGRVLGDGDLISASFDAESGDQNNEQANYFVSPGLVYFAPDTAGTYEFTLSADGVQIASVEVIKTAEFAALDSLQTSLDAAVGSVSYSVSDPDPDKLYKIQLMLGGTRGAGDYLLAETGELTELTYEDALDFSLTGNIAPSGTYYPTLLLLEYVTASDEAGNTVSTWTLADQVSFDAVSYTNNAAPAAPGNVTLTYSGNETMTASWTAPSVPDGYTVTGYQLSVYDEDGSQTGVFFTVNGLKDESGTLTEAPATELIMDLSTLAPPSEGANYSVGVKAVCETGEQLELTGAEAVSYPALLKKKAPPTLSYSANVIRGEGFMHTLTVGANGAEFTVSCDQTAEITVKDAGGSVISPADGSYSISAGTDTTLTILAKNTATQDYALEYVSVSSDSVAPPLVLNDMGVFPRHETAFGFMTYVTGHTEAGASVYLWKQEDYTAEILTALTVGEDGSFTVPLQFTGEPELCVQAMDAAGNLSAALTVSFAEDPVTVTLDKNNGSAECNTASIDTERGSSVGQLPRAYTQDKIFTGWYTAPDGGEAVDGSTVFDEDTVIFAHWADSVPISFYEGSFLVANVPVIKDAPIGELPEPAVTYDDKLFLGWSIGMNGELATEDSQFSSNKALYACWVDSVTVTFDAGQGNCEIDELRIPRGDSIPEYPEPELNGYTFEGWYDADENAVSASTIYDEDVVLYARWSRITAPLEVIQLGCDEGETLPDPVFTLPADAVGTPIISYSGTNGTAYLSSAKPTAAGSYTVTVRCDSFGCVYTGSAAFVITGSGVTVYDITVADDIENGSVSADKDFAVPGETVTLTVTPDEGFELSELIVTENGDDVALTPAGDGIYTFTVTEGDVEITAVFTPSVEIPELAITAQPVDYSGTVGDAVSFTVEATGSGLTYQWQFSSDAGKTWKDSGLPGNDTPTLSTTFTEARMIYRFRCVVTDAGGNSVKSGIVRMLKAAAD